MSKHKEYNNNASRRDTLVIDADEHHRAQHHDARFAHRDEAGHVRTPTVSHLATTGLIQEPFRHKTRPPRPTYGEISSRIQRLELNPDNTRGLPGGNVR